jgi:hypothetical protein
VSPASAVSDAKGRAKVTWTLLSTAAENVALSAGENVVLDDG